MTPFPLQHTFVVLKPDLEAYPVQVTPDLYPRLDADFEGFRDCLLVAEYAFDRDWPTWEVHPAGDELLYLLAGAADLILRGAEGEVVVPFTVPGTLVRIPRGTWHTARIQTPCRILFITPGEGTDNRETPPD